MAPTVASETGTGQAPNPLSPSAIREGLLLAFYGGDATGRIIGLCSCVTKGFWPEFATLTDRCGDSLREDDDCCPEWPECDHRLGAVLVAPEVPGWCARCGEYLALYRLGPV